MAFEFAERMCRVAYNRSASITHPDNCNKDWRAGYAVGCYTDEESIKAMRDEWTDRGEPSVKNPSWQEWKIGFWAGRYTRIQENLPHRPQKK